MSTIVDIIQEQESIEGEHIPATRGGGMGPTEYEKGFRDGLAVGVKETVKYMIENVVPAIIEQELQNQSDIKKALADGLRHGSSICGKELVETYRYKKKPQPRLEH